MDAIVNLGEVGLLAATLLVLVMTLRPGISALTESTKALIKQSLEAATREERSNLVVEQNSEHLETWHIAMQKQGDTLTAIAGKLTELLEAAAKEQAVLTGTIREHDTKVSEWATADKAIWLTKLDSIHADLSLVNAKLDTFLVSSTSPTKLELLVEQANVNLKELTLRIDTITPKPAEKPAETPP